MIPPPVIRKERVQVGQSAMTGVSDDPPQDTHVEQEQVYNGSCIEIPLPLFWDRLLTLCDHPLHSKLQLSQLHGLPYEVMLVSPGGPQGARPGQEVQSGLQERHVPAASPTLPEGPRRVSARCPAGSHCPVSGLFPASASVTSSAADVQRLPPPTQGRVLCSVMTCTEHGVTGSCTCSRRGGEGRRRVEERQCTGDVSGWKRFLS